MKWLPGNCLTTFVILASPLIADEPTPKITVFVYNYALLPASDLDEIKAQTDRVYRHSTVQIEWLDCPLAPEEAALFPACQVPASPTRLAVRILSQAMAERARRPPDSFGFAVLPEDRTFATVANVFGYRAERIAKRYRVRSTVVLGHVIAHELGHLLLGAGSHSNRGLMHVPWQRKQLEHAAQGTMMFTPGQSRRIRMNVRLRMAAANVDGLVPAC